MRVARDPAELDIRPRAVAIGSFDGVHRGHRAVIDTVRATGLEPTVITFDPHPRIALGNRVELLTTLERRVELLGEAGVNDVLVASFTPELQQLTPDVFADRYLRSTGVETVVAGADFRFGVRRSGDLALLERLGYEVVVVPELAGVSSTAIRAGLAEGDVRAAAAMLGRPFELDGVVVAGDQRGGTLGYPTANLRLEPDLACPAYGIYAGSASAIVRRSRSGRIRTTAARSGGSSRTSSTSRAICTESASWSSCGSACGTRPSSSPRRRSSSKSPPTSRPRSSPGGRNAIASVERVTAHNGQPLIHARDLVKRFGDFVAVDGIDFDLQRGEAFGFLGPNGAGKTSTMRMIGCVSPVTDGTLRVLGMDPARDGSKIRGRLGVVPQQDTLDMELTVRENIIIYGRYFGLPRKELGPRADELLDFVELTERANDKVEPLSGGMKRRLTIARSLVNEPEVLLLDEPTTGLDPQARHVVWDRLYRLKRQGVTLLLTTHYMDEAEQLCDRLVVMDHGKIVAEGSPRDLIERYSTREVVELRFDDGSRPDDLGYWTDGLVERVEPLPDRVLLYTDDGDAASHGLHERGLVPESVMVRRSTLEDVFLHLTGRSLIE